MFASIMRGAKYFTQRDRGNVVFLLVVALCQRYTLACGNWKQVVTWIILVTH